MHGARQHTKHVYNTVRGIPVCSVVEKTFQHTVLSEVITEDVCLSSSVYGSSATQSEGQIGSMILDLFVLCQWGLGTLCDVQSL